MTPISLTARSGGPQGDAPSIDVKGEEATLVFDNGTKSEQDHSGGARHPQHYPHVGGDA